MIAPQQRIVLLPGAFAAEFPTGFGLGGLQPVDVATQFVGATNVTASIDCVIFGDGTTSGPDESNTKKSIRGRRLAAAEIGRVVSNASAAKQDVAAALSRYEQDSIEKGTPEEQQWRRRLVQSLKRRKHLQQQLARQYMNLPDLPATW